MMTVSTYAVLHVVSNWSPLIWPTDNASVFYCLTQCNVQRIWKHHFRLANELWYIKGKGQYICIAPYCRLPTSKALRYSNALSRDLTVLPAHPRVYLRTE